MKSLKNKGITLIALIITIIVLLILAGVTIATLTGENGILNKAETAKEQTIIAGEKEEIALAYNAVKLKNKGGNVTAEELETELKGKAKVIEKNSKLVITYQETGRKYYIKQDGKIEKLEGENTEIDIQVGDIIFTYSIEGEEYNESIWTNKNIKVTAKINEENITNNGDYEIQITRTPDIEESWKTEVAEEFTVNGTLYARLIDTFERKTKSMLSTNVTNIDKEIPIIGSVTGSTATVNSGTITVSSISDIGGSGISGIYISTSSSTPSATASGWIEHTASNYTKTVTSNGTYYVWGKDNAGNISETQTCTVSGIVAKVTGVTLTDTTVNKGSTLTISKTLTGSTSYKSIEFTSSNTEVATIVSDTGVATGVSAGTSTITCIVTNYDETTVKGTCTLTVKSNELYDNVEIGDYVAYDATDNYAYGDIKTSSDINWRVFSKDSTENQIILISEGAIGSFSVNDDDYRGKFNRVCAIFGNGVGAEYARSFSEKDFCEKMNITYGSGPSTRYIDEERRLYDKAAELIYVGASYFMETQYVGFDSGDDTITPIISYWDGMYEKSNGELWVENACDWITVYTQESENVKSCPFNTFAVRPVVHLKNTVKTTGKDENGAWIIVDE